MVSSSLPSDSISVRSRRVATVPKTAARCRPAGGARPHRRALVHHQDAGAGQMDLVLGGPPRLEELLEAGRQGQLRQRRRRLAPVEGRRSAAAATRGESQQLCGLVVVHHHPAPGINQDHALAHRVEHRFVVGEELGELLRAPAPRHPAQVPPQQPGRHRAAHQQGQADGQQRRQPAGDGHVHRPHRHAGRDEGPHCCRPRPSPERWCGPRGRAFRR